MPEGVAVESLSGLLAELGVKQVYWIDDATDTAGKIARIQGLAELPGKLGFLRNEFSKLNITLSTNNTVAKAELGASLEAPDTLNTIIKAVDEHLLATATSGELYEGAIDSLAEKSLGALFEGVPYEKLLPTDWQERREAIIETAKSERTFFVFDKLLGNGVPDGDVLMQSVIDENLPSKPIFGLLSHTIDFDQETELTRQFQIDGKPTTAISKKLMRQENATQVLRQRIRSAVLFAEAKQLREICEAQITNSVNEAILSVKSLSASDFDQLIFQSSYREGIHEIETVLRIYTNELTSSLRSKLRGNQKVLEDINRLRSFRGAEKPMLRSDQAIKVQQSEYYESGEFVNSCLMPVEPGDIFEIEWHGGKKREYVVIAQPCDLMIRHDGTRKLENVILCPIHNGSPGNTETTSFKLDLFNADGSDSKIVFKNAITIPCWKLDCCTTNSKGLSFLDTNTRAHTLISEGCKALYMLTLLPKAQEIRNQHSAWMKLPLATRKKTWMVPPYIDRPIGCTVIVRATSTKVTMGIRRTRRINRSITNEILLAFASNISRPAREHQLIL